VTPAAATPERLPLWRLIAGIAVLAGMAAVLLSLAPVYLDNYRLQRYVNQMAHEPRFTATPDDAVREQVMARARELRLPVKAGDIQIARPGGGLKLEMKYAVDMNLALYRVNVHFHQAVSADPAAQAP
jgi:hypothetical protein